MSRVYLDWNATAPLRPEARAAMIAAMDVIGNPSSVHAEGRAAKAIVEKARGQVAELVGCDPSEIVFTSGATEAATIVLACHYHPAISPVEHDCIFNHKARDEGNVGFELDKNGIARVTGEIDAWSSQEDPTDLICLQYANGETGVIQRAEPNGGADWAGRVRAEERLMDVVQSVFRIPKIVSSYADFHVASSHKLGGPKGVGLLCIAERASARITASTPLRGGGQESGRRSGTENVIGIAGFGAAAEAATRDLQDGVWDQVEELRNYFEDMLQNEAPDIIIFGKDVGRLPNTSCFAIPGWKGETQVMQMDLAGYAISAGSACSSGKVKESRVLRAMGFDSVTASSAVRVSMGPTTTEDEVMGFARTWIEHYRRFKARAA